MISIHQLWQIILRAQRYCNKQTYLVLRLRTKRFIVNFLGGAGKSKDPNWGYTFIEGEAKQTSKPGFGIRKR